MKRVLISICFVFLLILSSFQISARLSQQEIEPSNSIDLVMQILMKISKVPSVSACIIKEDELIWSNGYGYYDIENNKKANSRTLYNIASISKMVTATAIMQLYDQGLFDLDDDVNNYMPFTISHPHYPNISITFRMLLSHQSGLSEDPLVFYKYFEPEYCPIPLYPWIETYLNPEGDNYTTSIWSIDPPGEMFHYANVGYALIGYLVEIMSGQPFYLYCDEHIFRPLKMDNTSFTLSDVNISNVAIPYHYQFNKYIPYGHYCYLGYPSGSIHTSVTDFSHFIIAHMNEGNYDGYQLLNESTANLMHTIQYPNGDYGFGWGIWTDNNEEYIGHTGGDLGVATSVTVRTSDSTAVMYFTNGEPWRLVQNIAWLLFEKYLFSITS
jgi:CubicO group peptidase (beta-lactamase class C family)